MSANSYTSDKILGLRDISLMTFISNFGVRWLAVAAAMGAASLFFWVVGAIVLALPLAYLCAKLSRLYPQEGGIYAWIRNSLGEKNGFIIAWLYFINNLFYYPAILIFLATNLAYVIGKPALANNSTFICDTVLVSFWFLILISLIGLKANKVVTEYGGIFGSIIPALLIIGLGFGIYFYTHHSATPFAWHNVIPNHHIDHTLANLTMLMFAMTGVEIIPTFANAVKNPKRDLYFGLMIGAALLVLFYILGTAALNIVMNPDDIRKTSGLIHAFSIIFATYHFPWMTKIVASLLVVAELAAVSIWLIAPITLFFKCTPRGLLPLWMQKTNKDGTPVHAILLVGFVVTAILLATNFLPAVNDMYQILVLMSVLFAFIPYLFIVVVFLKEQHQLLDWKKIKTQRFLHLLFSLTVTLSLLLGIGFSFELPSNITTLSSKIVYESELFFGPVIFVIIGYWIYHRWEKNLKN